MMKKDYIKEMEKELYYFEICNSLYQKTIDRNKFDYGYIVPYNKKELIEHYARFDLNINDYEKLYNIFSILDEYKSSKKTKYKNITKKNIIDTIKDIKYFVRLMQKEIRNI